MSININRPITQKNLAMEPTKAQTQQDVRATDNKTSAVVSNQDSVQLTPQAMNLNKMQTQAPSESQVNMKRVETLKSAILNGEYKINSERLAEKIGRFEADFNKTFTN